MRLNALFASATGLSVLFASCSGGGSSVSGSTQADFVVEAISVLEGAEWQINRPIDIAFNKAVDFSTVSMNTINVVDEAGGPATGIFTQPQGNPLRVRFQPTCPTLPDFSDAGLLPATNYILNVVGSVVGGVTVRSTAGEPLEQGRVVQFHTPNSTDPLALFLDTVPGPPGVRVRGAGGVSMIDLNATYVEVAGNPDPASRLYFSINPASQLGILPVPVPLNKYSEASSQIAVVVHLNQPVDATEANISSTRITLEHFDNGSWEPFGTEVELIENCSETGAAVRLKPNGILPQDPNDDPMNMGGHDVRVNLKQGFADLTGDQTSSNATGFANMDTEEVSNPGTVDPSVDSDELLEPFLLSGDEQGSLEDTLAAFAVPHAEWGEGELVASFGFNGSGGPGGNFDWHIPPGTVFILDTTSDIILGGPGGVPAAAQTVINGIVDIRNLFIPATSRLIAIGPNPLQILASGSVTIEGQISVNGSDNQGVGTLNTTNLPEPGASGQAGGGSGGTGSFLTSQSTPHGGHGFGAFEVTNVGGEGGESSYADGTCTTAGCNRRAAGGGGGAFGPDIPYDYMGDIVRCQSLIGMDIEPGGGGGPGGKGAVSQTDRAQGGVPGQTPFVDGFDNNNFLGSQITAAGDLILGELLDVHAAGGGGAGGDAVNSPTFPLVPFTITGDEKGSGGGGGAGGLKILAIGPIVVGVDGTLKADGGHGGGGENTAFFDRVGGGSGGGAGGHIVLSSASSIAIHGVLTQSGFPIFWYTDDENQINHSQRSVSALGGQGGAGHGNNGGANEGGNTQWRCDSIPLSHFEGTMAPPSQNACYLNLPDSADPLGPVVGVGGDGGPGMIQLHVNTPATDLLFPGIQVGGNPPYGMNLDVTPAMAPPPVGWNSPTAPTDNMVPFFGKLSMSRTKWIPLGLARVGVGGALDQVMFAFGGVDAAGVVLRDGEFVQQLPPIIPPAAVDVTPPPDMPPFLDPDGVTIVFDAQPLGTNESYKRNANLMRDFTIVLEDTMDPTNVASFEVEAAYYQAPPSNRFRCSTAGPAGAMKDFVDAVTNMGSTVNASLVPHFFRVETNTLEDGYPLNTEIKILFDATVAGIQGEPNEQMSYSAQNGGNLATDVTELNANHWDFFRFQVEYNLDTGGSGVNLTSPRPGLRFLRMPFDF